jgi:hypothetical protein
MKDDHQSAMELAGRIDADVLALRDAVGLGAAGVDCPQDVWQILVSLMDVPGRIANVVETLDRYLRRAIEDFAADNNADPAVRVVDAVDELAVAMAHLTDAAAPLHRAAQAVSGLRLTPAAAEALDALDDGEAAD